MCSREVDRPEASRNTGLDQVDGTAIAPWCQVLVKSGGCLGC